MIINDLPYDHDYRNTPLSGFFYRWKNSNAWLEIKPSFWIAKKTYNQLGKSWTDNDIFSTSIEAKPLS